MVAKRKSSKNLWLRERVHYQTKLNESNKKMKELMLEIGREEFKKIFEEEKRALKNNKKTDLR